MERGTLDLAAVGGITAAGLRIIGAQHFGDVAVRVLHTAGTLHQIRALQAALRTVGGQSLVLGHRDLHKVFRLDPQMAREGDLMGALRRVGGVVLHREYLALALGIVGHRQLHRMQHRHSALGGGVQILPQAVLQRAVLDDAGGLAHTDHLAEIADGGGGVAPAAQAAQGGHPGIVPAGNIVLLHQLAELPLGHDGVVDVQAGKLNLPGLVVGDGDVVHHPVVQGTVLLILQGAQAVGDALQRVLNGMGKVVHREDAPLGALPVVVDEADAVDDGVAHVEVAAGQVDLGAEGHLALLHLAVLHLLKQPQVLLDGPVTVGGHGGDADVAAVGLKLLRRQLADVGKALLDELHRVLIVLLEIVGAIEEPVAPVEAQPVDILLDGVHILGVLLGGVGVIHAQVAQAVVPLSGAEVDAQGLAVADMQIAVRLRREAGVDGHSLELTTLCDVLVDEIDNEVFAGLLRFGGLDFLGHDLSHTPCMS